MRKISMLVSTIYANGRFGIQTGDFHKLTVRLRIIFSISLSLSLYFPGEWCFVWSLVSCGFLEPEKDMPLVGACPR